MFDTLKQFSVKDYWVLQVKEDLTKCKIKLTEKEIACMKQEKFRKMVDKSIQQPSDEFQNYCGRKENTFPPAFKNVPF